MQAEGFDLVPRLIGRGGGNLRRIAEATAAKIRVRGKGSGHLEGDSRREAPTPLMVAVTTDDRNPDGFRRAVEMTARELRTVEDRFRSFLTGSGQELEGRAFSVGLVSDGALTHLEGLEEALGPVPPRSGFVHGRE